MTHPIPSRDRDSWCCWFCAEKSVCFSWGVMMPEVTVAWPDVERFCVPLCISLLMFYVCVCVCKFISQSAPKFKHVFLNVSGPLKLQVCVFMHVCVCACVRERTGDRERERERERERSSLPDAPVWLVGSIISSLCLRLLPWQPVKLTPLLRWSSSANTKKIKRRNGNIAHILLYCRGEKLFLLKYIFNEILLQ